MFINSRVITNGFHNKTPDTSLNRRYSYSPKALGRETSQHDCEAKAGNFLAKTQTDIGLSRLNRCKTLEISKNLQDLKAETLRVS